MNQGSLDVGQEHGFDWDAIRQRVAEATAAMEESIEMSPEELQRTWARRAAELARAPAERDEGEHIRLVLIRLGRETYGIDARYVFNVKLADLITFVPRVPEWVAGVVNLRGRVFSVVDLRRFFGLPPAQVDKDEEAEMGGGLPYLVVVETPNMEIALLADDVLTVESVPISQVQDTSGTVRGLRPEYVRGVIAHAIGDTGEASTMVVVLDLLALLTDERLIVHEEIL
jgi:purine-binding chemotaxis protein CheW